jgi:hypothetical protein
MPIQVNHVKPVVADDCCVDTSCDCDVYMTPGVYLSDKESMMIVPEGSTKGKTESKANSCMCLLIDADSGRAFFKSKMKLKGNYTYVCALDQLEMTFPTDIDS